MPGYRFFITHNCPTKMSWKCSEWPRPCTMGLVCFVVLEKRALGNVEVYKERRSLVRQEPTNEALNRK